MGEDGIPFTMDIDLSHDIPGEMADVLEVKTDECNDCGEQMRAAYDHEPGQHYCSECGVYRAQGTAVLSVVGP